MRPPSAVADAPSMAPRFHTRADAPRRAGVFLAVGLIMGLVSCGGSSPARAGA